MMQRFGGADFLQALLASPGTGVDAFDDALQKLGAKQCFQIGFTDWMVANYINDPKVGDGRYAYDALESAPGTALHVDDDAVTHVTRYPYTVSADVHQYARATISAWSGARAIRWCASRARPRAKVLDTDAAFGPELLVQQPARHGQHDPDP